MRFLKYPFSDGRSTAASLTGLGRAPLARATPLPEAPPPVSESNPPDTHRDYSEARLQAVLWGSDMGMWEIDVVTDTTRWFNDWCARFDVDPCEGRNHVARWDAGIHPDDRDAKVASFGAMLAGREPHYAAEYRIADRSGEWLWIAERGSVIARGPDGLPLRLVVVCREIGAHKQAEEALRTSEFRYRSVASMAPGYIFEYRFLADGGIQQLWVSEGVQAVYGVSQEEILRLGSRDSFVDPEWRPLLAEWRAAIRRGEARKGELKAHTITGHTKWLQASAVPVRDPRSGEVIGAIGSVYDITESKLAEIAVHESRSTLLTVAESSADVLALFDRERKCVFLNRPIQGLTPDAWLGAPVEDFAPPEDRARVHEIFERVINTGVAHDFEQVFTDANRRVRCLEMRVRAVQSGDRVLGAVVNITEVTEQRAQRDTLRTQARILETMREGVVLVDAANMIIRLTNPTFDRLFGYRTGELIGHSVEPLISLPGTQRKRFERGLRDHHRMGAAPIEFECIRQDGSRFTASCVLSPLSMGGTDHWLAVINDVTERKRLERGIIEIANREQQRIGSDLHDGLGQELTGIALMLRRVAAQLAKEKSSARLDIEDVIGLVNHAIENTRSIARGLSPVSPQSGGLAAALHALAARASERYGLRVEFRNHVSVPLELNEAYATHLYRIAQEALTNVVRHSLASEVVIGLEIVGDELQLRVDDNGRGFTHQPPGAAGGLGLKLMRYRAQMLGGDLMLETSANGGASVRCSCPLER
ncbi:MAG TPA: PAS domain S-box protein [Steroidobacteraceae bacterium]|jgi:PAS domain S-box-containing protein|nr:PAS domain S-box protein [Steroidobacteraceae bacterium]